MYLGYHSYSDYHGIVVDEILEVILWLENSFGDHIVVMDADSGCGLGMA